MIVDGNPDDTVIVQSVSDVRLVAEKPKSSRKTKLRDSYLSQQKSAAAIHRLALASHNRATKHDFDADEHAATEALAVALRALEYVGTLTEKIFEL